MGTKHLKGDSRHRPLSIKFESSLETHKPRWTSCKGQSYHFNRVEIEPEGARLFRCDVNTF